MARITLFKDSCMAGETRTFNQAVANLKDVGFNDKTSSIVVTEGTWQLFKDDSFRNLIGTVSTSGGAAQTNAYPKSSFWGGSNDNISSLKPV